ncbi:MAG: LemA family protein [Chromatiales bacterium]|jgi:LemA protein|nr:LemA family protein [Chromatiales bacterium]MDH4014035.1 LemA family protein [Chromatiales bacterium]
MIALLLTAAAVIVGAILVFNRLVRERNRVRAAWSDIDVQLTRRHDLIPQLVEAVKAYSDYEKATLLAVTELRGRSEGAQRLVDKAELEDQIEAGLHRLIALAESYPDLKASENFLELQRDLTEVEDHLQYARRFYNGAVRIYNTRLDTFPDLLVARPMRFRPAEFFEAAGTDVRATPRVGVN